MPALRAIAVTALSVSRAGALRTSAPSHRSSRAHPRAIVAREREPLAQRVGRSEQRLQIDHSSGDLGRAAADDGARRRRAEPDRGDPGASEMADADRRQHLPDDQGCRLALDPAVHVVLLKADAEVDDDLDAAVGNDWLGRAGAFAFEDPETVHDGGERGRRRVLGVAHEAILVFSEGLRPSDPPTRSLAASPCCPSPRSSHFTANSPVAGYRGAIITIAVLAVLLSAGTQSAPPSEPLGTSTASLYKSIRRNLLEAAEKMPAEHYAFKPTPDVRSFGELIGHVANTSYNFCAPVTKTKPPAHPSLETLTAKAALVAALTEALAFCDQATTGSPTRSSTDRRPSVRRPTRRATC